MVRLHQPMFTEDVFSGKPIPQWMEFHVDLIRKEVRIETSLGVDNTNDVSVLDQTQLLTTLIETVDASIDTSGFKYDGEGLLEQSLDYSDDLFFDTVMEHGLSDDPRWAFRELKKGFDKAPAHHRIDQIYGRLAELFEMIEEDDDDMDYQTEMDRITELYKK